VDEFVEFWLLRSSRSFVAQRLDNGRWKPPQVVKKLEKTRKAFLRIDCSMLLPGSIPGVFS
jgi:hypothetical protein